MQEIQVGKKTINLLEADEFQLDYKKEKRKKIIKNKYILAFAVCVIIFLLIPKFNFINNAPKIGDLITKDIVAETNVLLKDKDATKFKIKKSLSNLSVFLDYDPLAYQKLIEKVRSSFSIFLIKNTEIRKQEIKFQEEKYQLAINNFWNLQNIEKLKNAKLIYKKYLSFLKDKNQINNIYSLPNANSLQNKENTLKQERQKLDEVLIKTKVQDKEFTKNISINYDNNLGKFFQELRLNFDQEIFTLLQQITDYELFFNRLIAILIEFDRSFILNSKDILQANLNKEIQIFNLETNASIANSDRVNFLDLKEVDQIIKKYIEQNFKESTHLNLALYLLAKKLLIPTSFENKQKLEAQRKIITSESNSVFINIAKGTVLVKKGNILGKDQSDIITNYYNNLNQGKGIFYTIGIISLILLIILIIFITLKIERKSVDIFYENFVILLCSVATGLIIISFVKGMLNEFSVNLSLFSLSGYIYALPITISAMLGSSLVNFRTNMFNVFLTALCITFYLEEAFLFFIYCWLSASFTCMIFVNLNTRFDLLKKGAITAMINMLILFVLELLKDPSNISLDILQSVLFAFMGGMLSTILNIILLPLFEQIFGISTQLKLLELSNLNHPLLKLLQNRCLGTYQHSILVGSLAEAGAQKIGSNSLLVKIGAYYHDIGKAVEPQYFNENYHENEKSIHDDLPPQESAKKIINHIVYGIQFSKKFKLGQSITEFIMEHHGNSTIQFFYNKACRQKGEQVVKKEFCYPMPRPRSIETAVIMLADSSEVTVRSLKKTDKHSITKTINDVFQYITDNQQLDLSGISIKQIRILKSVFINILVSLNHNRALGK